MATVAQGFPDFPPYSTVQGYFYAWSRTGLFASLNYTLVMASREATGREASPSAGVYSSGVGRLFQFQVSGEDLALRLALRYAYEGGRLVL